MYAPLRCCNRRDWLPLSATPVETAATRRQDEQTTQRLPISMMLRWNSSSTNSSQRRSGAVLLFFERSRRSSAQLYGASDVRDRPAVTLLQPSRLPAGNEGRRRRVGRRDLRTTRNLPASRSVSQFQERAPSRCGSFIFNSVDCRRYAARRGPSFAGCGAGRGQTSARLVAVRRSSDRSVYNPWRRSRHSGTQDSSLPDRRSVQNAAPVVACGRCSVGSKRRKMFSSRWRTLSPLLASSSSSQAGSPCSLAVFFHADASEHRQRTLPVLRLALHQQQNE